MGVKRKQTALGACKSAVIAGAIGWFLVVAAAVGPAFGEPPSPLDSVSGTVTIDAGHGGRDAGSQGAAGTPEKEVCLALARQLTDQLEPAYRVVLTRSDDYDVALPDRTAIANHYKSDLLISLHTAASFQHSTTGIQIYYFQPPGKRGAEPAPAPAPQTGWSRVQLAHLEASHALATILQAELEKLPGRPAVQVFQAPLVILEGADMPAVVIEAGYLTHPSTETDLTTSRYQTAFAQAVARGVELYLASVPKPRHG